MKIAIIQLCSALEPEANLSKIQKFIDEAKSQMDIEAVFLPEVFYSMSNGVEPTPHLVEKGNDHYNKIRQLAIKNKVYLLGGTAATKNHNGAKVLNRNYNFSPMGVELTSYDKMHLFSVDLSETESKTVIDESMVYASGDKPQTLDIGPWKMGLSICFDLRFPELYRSYFDKGVNLITISSAFTVPTGKAHWEVLNRARAIENQSYVVATNQWGDHNEKIKTYGHSLLINPWGEVLIDLGEKEGVATFELDISEVEKVRKRMNVKPNISLV